VTTDEQREGWRSVAAGWERRREAIWEATRSVSERLVSLLDPKPGETVLELAAGSGDTGFLAGELVGPSGRLVSSDFVPEIVESARRRADELGLENVEFAVLDAQALDLADESVDGVLCRWGYMLAPDPAAALGETYRILRPGGRVSLAVWGSAEENPWASTIGVVLAARGLAPPPEPDAPGPFRLGDRARVVALLEGAGLEVVVHEDEPLTWSYGSFDEFWEITCDVSRALQTALEGIDARTAADVRDEVVGRLEAYRQDGALVIPGVTQVALARRPE